jgi:hypothetical protein
MRTIICYYEPPPRVNVTDNDHNSLLTPSIKRIYSLFIIIIRVFVPFLLLLTANIFLFGIVRERREQLLVRHGHHGQITPMIFFSSCILLLTVSPR